MKNIKLGTSDLQASEISLGCMSMVNLNTKEAANMIDRSIDAGINFFDHADIYGAGKSEEIFAEALKRTGKSRDDIIIQSKTGIRKGYYDFSKEHILKSAEESLTRLQTDYLDVYLLHRPDALCEPEEVAEAFIALKESGKVRHFGVSNHNPMQIELLKKYLPFDLIVNQLQLSVMHTGMIDAGIQVNTLHDNGINRDGSILDYSRLNDMTIQAWSPFRYGNFEGLFIDNDDFKELNEKLQEIGDKYGVNKSAVAVAWILRHPARIQTIVGTMKPERLNGIVKASGIELSREDWYDIYRTAGNPLP